MTKEEIQIAKYHDLCARATLYPGKSFDEVTEILNKKWDSCENRGEVVTPIPTIDFKDSSGTPVSAGDVIKIIRHHNYIFNNQKALLSWNSHYGMFEFSCLDKQLSGRQDFYGVATFIKSQLP
jgi:hypothetical protein